MEINIDKEIDAHHCPEPSLCVVATTYYEPLKRENKCYHCWLEYCKKHKIKIIYD